MAPESRECSYLFAYGTLMPDCVPPQMQDACQGMELVGHATVRGILYDLGPFPGVVDGEGTVRGVLLRVPPGAWDQLDRYEACPGPDHPDGLFHRVKTRATTEDGQDMECWLYIYARDVSGFEPVPSGRWERKSNFE